MENLLSINCNFLYGCTRYPGVRSHTSLIEPPGLELLDFEAQMFYSKLFLFAHSGFEATERSFVEIVEHQSLY